MDHLTELLVRAREGDERAFGEVVRTMYPQVTRFCAHLVGSAAADDATQETFIAAWRSVSTFRGESSAKTWLFVIARRSASRTSERQRKWRNLADAVPLPASFPRPDRAAEIDDLLWRIPEDRRTALLLTQLIGLTYAEAADVCGCEVGTIRSRVARARKQLLDLMEGSHSVSLEYGT